MFRLSSDNLQEDYNKQAIQISSNILLRNFLQSIDEILNDKSSVI
jgi:hypothetical protein